MPSLLSCCRRRSDVSVVLCAADEPTVKITVRGDLRLKIRLIFINGIVWKIIRDNFVLLEPFILKEHSSVSKLIQLLVAIERANGNYRKEMLSTHL